MWIFLLYEPALAVLDAQRGMKRKRLRGAFSQLAQHPFTVPDREIHHPNERVLSVLRAGDFEIIYWLDGRVKHICIVNILRVRA